MERANQCYYDDFPIYSIEIWINEFFDQLQPERLSPEDATKIMDEIENHFRKVYGICDSPNSENK